MNNQNDDLNNKILWPRRFIYSCGDWIPPAEIAETPFARRRHFFQQHALHSQGYCTCPACGYPTLAGRGSYDYCSMCHWEDDGQDDPRAAELNDGPNGLLSLKQARVNFEITSSIFAFSEAEDFLEFDRYRLFSETAQREGKALRILYDGLMALIDEKGVANQWLRIEAQWKRRLNRAPPPSR